MQKALIIIAISVIALIIGFYVLNAYIYNEKQAPQEESTNAVTYFANSLTVNTRSAISDYETRGLGGGVDGFILREAYPGFMPQDFEGVKALGGSYSVQNNELTYTGNAASNSGILIPEGFKTLLANVSERLNLKVDTKSEIDSVIISLEPISNPPKIENTTGPPIAESWGTIYGTVLFGPVCPVVQYPPDSSCDDRPYETRLTLTTSDGTRVIREFSSGVDGKFNIEVPAGTYAIRGAANANIFPTCSSREAIQVPINDSIEADVFCDSGIR